METEVYQHDDGTWRVMLFVRDIDSMDDANDFVDRCRAVLPRGFTLAKNASNQSGGSWAQFPEGART